MEFDTAFYHEQTKPGARARSHIAPAMEGFEQLLLIFRVNADSVVADNADRVSPVPFNRKMHGLSRFGVFHRVAQKIGEYVPE